HVPDLSHEGIPLQSVTLDVATLQAADCVVVVTNHAVIDWAAVAGHARLIVDTRNAIRQPGPGRVVPL
ncbi:MAG: UDP-N-acetyl-D-glucosamine dehydrogenase, partial [Anaerolineales bacterium]|nr:UDP-N-acetyl-D-glucosamine dehydrogenase [Anaerolineales bacterium]